MICFKLFMSILGRALRFSTNTCNPNFESSCWLLTDSSVLRFTLFWNRIFGTKLIVAFWIGLFAIHNVEENSYPAKPSTSKSVRLDGLFGIGKIVDFLFLNLTWIFVSSRLVQPWTFINWPQTSAVSIFPAVLPLSKCRNLVLNIIVIPKYPYLFPMVNSECAK